MKAGVVVITFRQWIRLTIPQESVKETTHPCSHGIREVEVAPRENRLIPMACSNAFVRLLSPP